MQSEYSFFRDPSGRIFSNNGIVYRQINQVYATQYNLLMKGGLYQALTDLNQLVTHEEISNFSLDIGDDTVYKIIRPVQIPFISYPYEWSFQALKDAALLTLTLQRKAMDYGMSLKDASAYNIQFLSGNPIFIDTLSFDIYENNTPWGAYGQFCRHFLSPLLLMVHKDIRLNCLLRCFIDGIPLDMVSCLLSNKGGMLAKMHIDWHSKSVSKHAEDGRSIAYKKPAQVAELPKSHLVSLVDDLIRKIEALHLKSIKTEWSDYYEHTNYDQQAFQSKEKLVFQIISQIQPYLLWDIGANNGLFSRIALDAGAQHVVSFDIDYLATQHNYNDAKKKHLNLLPLVLDLTNPSPSIGFANKERISLQHRTRPNVVIALAIIHHITISNNISFEMVAEWFSTLTDQLIIEFIPKDDSQVQLLLSTRKDIFPHYNHKHFEKSFSQYFYLKSIMPIANSHRTLYWFDKI